MKSFLELVEEKASGEKHHVFTFGRMNPPTTGHLKLIDKVKDVAKKNNATHTVVTSHSQDAKKNPLSSSQKVKHLQRYSSGTNFAASSKEHPTFLHHAGELHKKGVTHLHMVVGSDRVHEMKDKLHKYNGSHEGALYNFKKITVHSAGQRDPDAEGTSGMSGTKMREHAKNKNHAEFRKGVPGHVSDAHAKELMHDTRKGMGIHESTNRGLFKAIFITGGPGSGKDVIIREAIADAGATEVNLTQAYAYLADKQKLSEKTDNYRLEAIRNRGLLIINGPADSSDEISYVKEELEELGYSTIMIFVNTTNEVSQQRNTRLSRMMVESMRFDKWKQSQSNKEFYSNIFESLIEFNNNSSYEFLEEDITDTYQKINTFIDDKTFKENAHSWLESHGKISLLIDKFFKEENYVPETAKYIQKIREKRETSARLHKSHSSGRAPTPSDIPADNRAGDPNADNIKWDAPKRRGDYIFRTYSEAQQPKIEVRPDPKESNFSKDKEKVKLKKFGDKSLSASTKIKADGLSSEWNVRTNGTGLTGGAGLGNQTYSEETEYSVANPASTAMPSGGSPNPLSSEYATKKDFRKFRKVKESWMDPGDNEMGVGGTLGGSTKKEPMVTYKDARWKIGIQIKKKKASK
jgi:hypothetical protein